MIVLYDYNDQNALGIFFLIEIYFPHENGKTIGANYLLTKENGQSILVLVVYDAIMKIA